MARDIYTTQFCFFGQFVILTHCSVVARGWAIQALLNMVIYIFQMLYFLKLMQAKTHEGNRHEMREGGGGVIVGALQQLKESTVGLSHVELLQVTNSHMAICVHPPADHHMQVRELSTLIGKRKSCCIVS